MHLYSCLGNIGVIYLSFSKFKYDRCTDRTIVYGIIIHAYISSARVAPVSSRRVASVPEVHASKSPDAVARRDKDDWVRPLSGAINLSQPLSLPFSAFSEDLRPLICRSWRTRPRDASQRIGHNRRHTQPDLATYYCNREDSCPCGSDVRATRSQQTSRSIRLCARRLSGDFTFVPVRNIRANQM